MTKNTYNPYEIMMDKYDKEEMLSDVREAMLYQLGVDVSCEELNHFFTGKGKAALRLQGAMGAESKIHHLHYTGECPMQRQ